MRRFAEKHGIKKTLDNIGKEAHTGIKVITVITKQEIWVKG
jgi:hypothetical protein